MDQTELERIGDDYRAAYAAHDPAPLKLARNVRFTENNVELALPDGSWDAVTEEIGPALTFSDPKTGGVGIYTAIMMNDTPGVLAIRLKVVGGEISEVEHMLSTRRWISSPPTPFGDPTQFRHEPDLAISLKPNEAVSRDAMIAQADGYWTTLANNDTAKLLGGVAFAPGARRYENAWEINDDIETGFKKGFYAFNERVRDRAYMVVDEARGLVMSRAFIDHKGILDHYTLTDGTDRRSPFREPHTWSVLELFKVKNGQISGIEACFIGSPYYQRSPWTAADGI